MDFGLLPPEINSARMYSGPGSGPMLAAAASWDQLARDLVSSAAGYRAVIGGLTGSAWQGPSSARMADGFAPYLAWLQDTAALAEQTAAQARAAAGAYQTARAVTVPPPVIAANRTRLTALVAGNFFGQNSPAIAATEAHYEQMWAQDSGAMYGYADSAAAASNLTPFTQPPPSTAPAAAAPSLLTYLLQVPSLTSAAASISSSSFGGASIATTNHAIAVNALRDEASGVGPFLADKCGPATTAALGRASLAGYLSVPQSWTATTTPAVSPTTQTSAIPAAAVLPASPALPSTSLFGAALMGTLAGRGAKPQRPREAAATPATRAWRPARG